MAVLVTGGAGFIGTHTCVELLENGYEIVVVDNYSNSKPEALNRVEKITGKKVNRYEVDILNKEDLKKVFIENDIDSVIHFAGLKSVGESVSMPLQYYHNNITGTLSLLEVCLEFDVKKIVFSSSATVYGTPKYVPISEDFPLSATNPYGRTKLMIEEILKDLSISRKDLSIAILRYFNPIGAHKTGMIGEDPNGIPNNLMPYITQVAVKKREFLSVYGNDYSTHDGTGVRDYIHVVDLAKGHLAALSWTNTNEGIDEFNLGTGTGYSVLDVVKNFEEASGIKIDYKIVDRRPGDVAECYANPEKALKLLGWKAEKNIFDMCLDSWNWQKNNINGY